MDYVTRGTEEKNTNHCKRRKFFWIFDRDNCQRRQPAPVGLDEDAVSLSAGCRSLHDPDDHHPLHLRRAGVDPHRHGGPGLPR